MTDAQKDRDVLATVAQVDNPSYQDNLKVRRDPDGSMWIVDAQGRKVMSGVSADQKALGFTTSPDGEITPSLRTGPSHKKAYLLIGGDHPNLQWYGRSGSDGMMGLYKKYGISPYMAVNTQAVGGVSPGDGYMMSWAQIRQIRDQGCEIVSHSRRHYQDWEAPDAGITVYYTGAAATATAYVTSTAFVTSTAGAVDDINLAFATYPTLAQLVAAINATGKYVAAYSSELTGSEPSTALLTIASGAAKNIHTNSPGTGFSAAGGIRVWWDSAVSFAESCVITLNATTLQIFKDGLRLGSYTLASYTLSSLLAAIKGLSSALNADAFGNTVTSLVQDIGTQTLYCTGVEDASNLGRGLTALIRFDAWRFPAVIPAGGLTPHYLRRLNIAGAISDAAANGVVLKNFAQSGANFYRDQLHVGAIANQHVSLRGNVRHGVGRRPCAMPAGEGASFHYHAALMNYYNSPGAMSSLIAALVASPGHMIDILNHASTTNATPNDGTVAGSSGYYLDSRSIGADSSEAAFVELLSAINTAVSAGQIDQLTPTQYAQTAAQIPPPKNLIFNPIFAAQPVALNVADPHGVIVHGWKLNAASLSGVSVAGGKFSFTSAGTSLIPISQYVTLKRGASYRAGCRIDVSGGTLTNAYILMAFRQGTVPDYVDGLPLTTIQSETTTRNGEVALEFEMMNPVKKGLAKIIGSVAQPFNLSVNKNIQIKVDESTGFDIDCSVDAADSAAVTAKEVATAINSAIAANSQFVAKSEYHTLARAENGRVILEGVRRISYPSNGGLLNLGQGSTASATTLIFGQSTGSAWADHAGARDFAYAPVEFQVYVSATAGTQVSVSDPFVQPID